MTTVALYQQPEQHTHCSLPARQARALLAEMNLLTYVVVVHFTEDLDFSERPDAGEQRLTHIRDLL